MRQFDRHVRPPRHATSPTEPSDEDVRAAYRRKIQEVHPDHGGAAEEARAVIAEYEAFQGDTS